MATDRPFPNRVNQGMVRFCPLNLTHKRFSHRYTAGEFLTNRYCFPKTTRAGRKSSDHSTAPKSQRIPSNAAGCEDAIAIACSADASPQATQFRTARSNRRADPANVAPPGTLTDPSAACSITIPANAYSPGSVAAAAVASVTRILFANPFARSITRNACTGT